MIFNEIKCRVNTSLGLVGGMHPLHPPCPRLAVSPSCWGRVLRFAVGKVAFACYSLICLAGSSTNLCKYRLRNRNLVSE